MSWPVRIIAIVVGIGFTLVSIAINLQYGVKSGVGTIDQYIFVSLSVLGDVWKSLGLNYIVETCRRIQPICALAAIMVWVVCVAYSLSSALGYAAYNRATVADTISSRGSERSGLLRELDRKEQQRASLGAYEPANVIEARLAAEREKLAWGQSQFCRAPTARTRAFCIEYRQTETTLARAVKGAEVEHQLKALRAEITTFGTVAAGGSSGDGQSELLSQLLGLPLPIVQTLLSLLIVGVVELGSMCILFVALHPSDRPSRAGGAATPRAPANGAQIVDRALHEVTVSGAVSPGVAGSTMLAPGDTGESLPVPAKEEGRIEEFALAVLRDTPRARTLLADIECAYQAWCVLEGKTPASGGRFQGILRELCGEVGYAIETHGGVTALRDVTLTSVGLSGYMQRIA